MQFRSLLLFLVFIVSTAGCKKTYRDIGHEPEMMKRIDAFIDEMSAISKTFPKELTPLPEKLDPPLRYHDSVNSNAFIAETLQLALMDSDVGFGNRDYFTLGTTHTIRRVFKARHDGQKEAPEDYQQQLEAILDLQYVVAAFVTYVKPEIVDKETYTGGTATARVAVYDRKSDTWLGGFECQAKPKTTIEFKTTREGFFERDGLYALKSNARHNLMKEIHAGLKSIEDPQSLEEPSEAPAAKSKQ